MAEMARTKLEDLPTPVTPGSRMGFVHPAWLLLMRYCAELGHGSASVGPLCRIPTRPMRMSPICTGTAHRREPPLGCSSASTTTDFALT